MDFVHVAFLTFVVLVPSFGCVRVAVIGCCWDKGHSCDG